MTKEISEMTDRELAVQLAIELKKIGKFKVVLDGGKSWASMGLMFVNSILDELRERDSKDQENEDYEPIDFIEIDWYISSKQTKRSKEA